MPLPAIPPRQMLLGSLCALVTVCIWSGWNIVSRLGTTQSLLAEDITFLRFTTAGLLALPVLWHYRQAVRHAPKSLLLMMIIGAGAPYVYAASAGFETAPAAHGVLIPGTMVLWVALLSWWWLGESLKPARILGYGLIALTIIYRLITHGALSVEMLLADGWFLLASVLWAFYTVSNKQAGLPPLAAVAVVATGSLLFYCLPFAVLQSEAIRDYPLSTSLTQIVYQGVMVSFVALVSYNRAIQLIGASRASAFAALIPATTVLLAMPILQEFPGTDDIGFIAALSLGVLFATGLVAPAGRRA